MSLFDTQVLPPGTAAADSPFDHSGNDNNNNNNNNNADSVMVDVPSPETPVLTFAQYVCLAPVHTALETLLREADNTWSGVAGIKCNEVRAKELYADAAAQGCVVARGRLYEWNDFGSQDFEKCVELYRAAIASGAEGYTLASAQFRLGCCYAFGEGVPQDDFLAVQFFRPAAEYGIPQAANNFACSLRDGGPKIPKDAAQAAHWFRIAAEGGHANALLSLACAYRDGDGVRLDLNESIRLLRMGVAAGHAGSQVNLGYMFDTGMGLDVDKTEAVNLYRLAAEQNNPSALYNMGVSAREGDGLPQDFSVAASYFRKAADLNHAAAQTNLGYLYDVGKGVRVDKTEANRLYRAAAESGHPLAQRNLGLSFRNGDGIEINLRQALFWLRKAAAQDEKSALVLLGRMLASGEDPEGNNDEEAVACLRRGAREGAATADATVEAKCFDRYNQLLASVATPRVLETMLADGVSVRAFIDQTDSKRNLLHYLTAACAEEKAIALMDDLHQSALLLYELPEFDEFVNRPDDNFLRPVHLLPSSAALVGKLPTFVGCIENVRSIMSVTRASRCACLIWCAEQLAMARKRSYKESDSQQLTLGDVPIQVLAEFAVGPVLHRTDRKHFHFRSDVEVDPAVEPAAPAVSN